MTAEIPVNPEVLEWARTSAGLSIEEVVSQLGRKTITSEVIEAWENGEGSPSFPQLEKLAYDIYKRPVAIFFFPEPPEEVSLGESFRTLPDFEVEHLPARIRFLLRKARAFQQNLYELYDDRNPAENFVVKDLAPSPNTTVEELSKIVRDYLGISLEQQFELGSAEDAFKFWRQVIEGHGVFIFKDAFKLDAYSGFCVYDQEFPVIYVNNSKPHTRQIFTLFHELAHLLFRTGGIDTNAQGYIEQLTGDDQLIEVLCNRFSGEFLVPTSDFLARAQGYPVNEDTFEHFAHFYSVSREVILRKFADQGEVSPQEYLAYVQDWASAPIRSGSGGNYYFTQGTYLGTNYVEKAFGQYYSDRISVDQLAGYLNVKVQNIPGMEALIYPRGSAA